jgi:hypothetical protein
MRLNFLLVKDVLEEPVQKIVLVRAVFDDRVPAAGSMRVRLTLVSFMVTHAVYP